MNIARLTGIFVLIILAILFVKGRYVYAFNQQTPVQSAQLAVRTQQKTEDIRVMKLENYLRDLHSPLVENAQDFVAYADIYGYGENWSMVAAIAGVESTFGKRVPINSHNAWGWGIPTGASSGIGFDSWKEGIKTVTEGIRKNYMDRGAVTLGQIGRIYAPPSKTWAGNVAFFMNKIETTTIEPSLSL